MRLTGGTLVDPGAEAARTADLLWDGEEISGVQEMPGGEALATAVREAAPGVRSGLDATGCLVLPGLVCAYLETGLAYLPGLPRRGADEPQADRRRRCLSAMDEEALAAAARLVAMEAALAGTTAIFDVWRGPRIEGVLETIAAAFEEVGLRGALGVDVGVHPPGGVAARSAMLENVRFHQASLAKSAFRGTMPLSGVEAAGDFLEVAGAARRAEMAGVAFFGGTEAGRRSLFEKGFLRPSSLVVLQDPLGDEERALLRDLKIWVAIKARCDGVRESVDGGHPPPPSLRGILPRTTFGGWGAISDPLAERAAACFTRGDLAQGGSWSMIAAGYGLAAETFDVPYGRYAQGSAADFVVLEPAIPAPLSRVTTRDHLARLTAARVRHVVVRGRIVVENGKPARVDAAEIRAKAREHLRRVWSAAAQAAPPRGTGKEPAA